ncbi:endopeptidase La [Myxococcota bacterium]|nr:endopeptidase La [Myxococcota bacterium]MBU1509910.1 endopeptidase La [Myxococcota bacterium]
MSQKFRHATVEIPEVIPILPLRNAVLFPGSIIPIDVGRKKSVKLIEDALSREKPIIGILTQKDPQVENPQEDDLYTVGCAARVLKVIKLGVENFSVIIQGLARVEVLGFIGREPYITARIRTLPDDLSEGPGTVPATLSSDEKALEGKDPLKDAADGDHAEDGRGDGPEDDLGPADLEALMLNLRETARKVIKLMPEVPNEAAALIDSVTEPGALSDLIGANLDLPIEEKQAILETPGIRERMYRILVTLNRQLELLKVREQINSQVQEEMGKSQREYILRQQLKAIREELGELDEPGSEVEEIKAKIELCQMPEEAEAVALKQLDRLKMMNPASAEYTVVHSYLDWLVELPWDEATEDQLDIPLVRRILDEDHYDLQKVKKRIVEYLAVRKLNPDKKGPILCLVGPPGVGKTSLGKSIARAMGREFWRISLGGVRDEAEIRGHRRTYVGALPGRIIQGIRKVKVNNPVFMLDEIDKLGNDFRGDPASALLEVLDPEQNNTFSDHYLEVQFDLSSVMFIATANMVDTIPAALRDRMEILDLAGYTRTEKFHIARNYLIPRQLRENGIMEIGLELPDETVYKMIDNYTRESGVRNLERTIEGVCRSVAVRVAEGEKLEGLRVPPEALQELLGPQKFMDMQHVEHQEPGVATGLAWTPVGGDVIYVESRRMKGKGILTLTGQLGDVMKESAQAALSLLRADSAIYGISEDLLEQVDVHIHVPAGAVPKDGPSAGVTMFSSLLSSFTGRKVLHDVAMTGEITLRGRVLPVGGIKEKALAAHRAGARRLILPAENRKDLEEIPEEARREMEIIFVSNVSELPALVLEN